MNLNPNGPLQDPDLRAVLNAHRDEIFASLNCHQFGTVVSWQPASYTVSVKINQRRVVYNQQQTAGENLQQTPTLIEYPVLADVPIFVLSGGKFTLFIPPAVGDTCLVLFNDRDMDRWFTTGDTNSAPNSSRMHSLSDGVALIGVFSKANNPGVSGGDVILQHADGGFITLPSNGLPAMHGRGGAVFQAADLITVKGANGVSLAQVINTVLDALIAWVNTGGSTPNPATIAALVAAKTQVDATLS